MVLGFFTPPLPCSHTRCHHYHDHHDHHDHHQLHESLSPWPASTHSQLPLHWALHLIVIMVFQVRFDGEEVVHDGEYYYYDDGGGCYDDD